MVTLNIKSVTSMPPEAAIGQQAGSINQGSLGVAVGKQAGYQNQGANAVAIGAYAGFSDQTAGSIVLNASGSAVNATTPGFYVNPVRSVTTSSTGVVSYSANEMTLTSNIIMNTVTATTFVGNGSQLTGLATPLSISNVQITDSSWTILDDLAVSTTGGYCLVNGSGFAPGSMVRFGTDLAPAVSYVSPIQVRVQAPAKTSGSYDVTFIRGDTTTATLLLGITYSAFPAWSTSTDLGNVTQNTAFSRTLAATSDSNVVYANTSALPPQTTLASNGTFSGNITVAEDTTYTFTIKATDIELQDVSRTFLLQYFLDFIITDLAIMATGYHSFITAGRRSDGLLKAYGFGYNIYGQLGTTTNNSTENPNPTPTNIMNRGSLAGKTATNNIACGIGHTLVVCSDGSLHAFGRNIYGYLGTSTNSFTNTPNPTPLNISSNGSLSGKTVSKVACGIYHSIALCTDGTVHSFGWNYYGQLGRSTNAGSDIDNPSPTNISSNGSLSGKTASQIACGSHYTMILCTDGTLHSFGANSMGQLGLGTSNSTQNWTPVNISSNGSLSGKTVSKISCGSEFTLVLCTDGTLHSFGANNFGQLGTSTNSGTSNPNGFPINVTSNGSLTGKTVSKISCGYLHVLALCTDGTLHSYGYNQLGQLGTPTNSGTGTPNPTSTNITSNGSLSGKTISNISCGINHSFVLGNGSLHSFGGNYYGELGTSINNGTSNANPTPTNITSNVVQ